MRIRRLDEMLAGFDVRPAVEDDYDQIKRIANQHRNFLPFVMRIAIAESIKEGGFFVAHIGDSIIGFINFHRRMDGVTTLHEIGVEKGHRQLGVGKALMSVMDRPILLKVTQDNPANDFYKRLGFRLVGTQEGKEL